VLDTSISLAGKALQFIIMPLQNREQIAEAYNEVRNDKSDTLWLVCTYEGNSVTLKETGEDYDDMYKYFTDDDRAFAFLRVIMGDELSKRAKFAFIQWTGPNVGALKKAKCGTDKAEVKRVITSFAVELMADTKDDIKMETIRDELQRAGGANYGDGRPK